jgi:plasmid stabilization system protein ParE
MAKVIYSARALDGLVQALASMDAIESGVNHLAAHPLTGRRVEGDLRECVISFGETGYLALYRFIPQHDEVRVLAMRQQRELGYRP